MNIREQVCLSAYNSFGLKAKARFFASVSHEQEIQQALAFAHKQRLPVRILGGGSNLLLAADINALVLHIQSRGLRIILNNNERVLIEAVAGEPWHDFVQWTLAQNAYGLENLSLIPGSVGAAPIQNIGAYGVELKDHCHSLDALNLASGQVQRFSAEECRFAYRDSLFKQQPGRWLILRVRFALSQKPQLQLNYGDIRARLVDLNIENPTPEDISRVICAIRQEKLPNPAELGNAGSFFKNPIISAEQAEQLKQQYPKLSAWPQPDGQIKLAAAWLIEQAGWKGYRTGHVGVHQAQALVLVNYGGASGGELLQLAHRIQQDIKDKFNVLLEIEPTIW
ncbi:UDP-N-acetylenolpyruvoylglucosamine reductase [Ventosimonas gracilis]|uniref:UDP-N-acetylenolpyruvoylglucosamine reductase n=1 Tax=Ventosimonas gracilis TaxID=1680762 RepID=A0A139SYE7_9GAMM|nr:UDP-N-acetylmuramate dehydrogenase [Ventosimonas gracilis]KXU39504.1 UDP-N-acetylenolpyruvoylglucosamine reductase [Ventosimonas gracilis]